MDNATSLDFPQHRSHLLDDTRRARDLVPVPRSCDEVGRYVLPELPYALWDLAPFYDSATLAIHHDQHHAEFVRGANRALARLMSRVNEGPVGAFGQFDADLAFNLSEHVLHSIFWTNLAAPATSRPRGELRVAIDDSFGNLDRLRDEFTDAAMSLRGSGWAALAWEPHGGCLVVVQIPDHHTSVVHGTNLLLVCDMWEHAYYLRHQHDRLGWLESFWHLVDWRDVERRFVATGVFDHYLVEPTASPVLQRYRSLR